jgi:hypothetical protein
VAQGDYPHLERKANAEQPERAQTSTATRLLSTAVEEFLEIREPSKNQAPMVAPADGYSWLIASSIHVVARPGDCAHIEHWWRCRQ